MVALFRDFRKMPVDTSSSDYYKDFAAFVEYYGVTDYADKWVTAALTGTDARFQRGNADFSLYGDDGRIGTCRCVVTSTLYSSIVPC
jgi:hypothetical protein